ncbi:MAG: Vitamin B12 import ATP-binding protein BtuD [Chroococcopsis gigantea SAG 12.99]|jgi:lipopolysaccharide transport system ATP-binding protein|nr:Vitamin B12 import ATP-binding protein BtuD [Chroococcopsis gigantea SAG 12.99]
MSDRVIRVENLSKSYRIGAKQKVPKTAAEAIGGLLGAPLKSLRSLMGETGQDEEFWALKDVSFEVKAGEVVGIIGRNGAGKSTLLKILSRVTKPTSGHAEIRGRVGSLLEVGTGFHPELTGRENIYLNGAILGMRRWEIDKKFDEIVTFAEIDKLLDTPVKRYSSGMYVRLAFAVAAHLETEILIVDEVLAVGDAAFQKKCLGKMSDVATEEGRTILFVSHNMAAIKKLCCSGIVLERGHLNYGGNQTEAIDRYLQSLTENRLSIANRKDRAGSGSVKVIEIEIKDDKGVPLDVVQSGQTIDIHLHFQKYTKAKLERVIFSVQINTQFDVPVFLLHNRLSGDNFGELPDTGTVVCRIDRLPLPAANYPITYSLIQDNLVLDSMNHATEMSVTAGDFYESGELPPITHGVSLANASWRLKKELLEGECRKAKEMNI